MRFMAAIGIAGALALGVVVPGCAAGTDDFDLEDIAESHDGWPRDVPADDASVDDPDGDGGGEGAEDVERGDEAASDDDGGERNVARLGPEVEVASGQRPIVASDSLGNPHVVFEDGGIWYTVGDGTTGRFAAPVRLSDAGNESQLVIDENDDAHAVWNIGVGGAGISGWYSNNIGGSWKPAVRVLSVGELGTARVMQGRVLKVPGRDEAVTAWSGGADIEVLARLGSINGTPSVLQSVAVRHWVPGLVLDPSGEGFRTVARTRQGSQVTSYDFALVAHGSFMVMNARTSGESGSGFLTADGEVHYTGAPGGTATEPGPAHVWYNNDTRVASGRAAIQGMMVGPESGGWSAICVDVLGQVYVTHTSWVDTNAWIAYLRGEELISVVLAADYGSAQRKSPSCSPAALGGAHVVYDVASRIIYRTVGLP
jgi:hypothetical protein